ncbi:MAG: PHP domain-containing protein [Defluviitaleaceae bacterium]|nr:PHP domain-containing protein [Defluviitaleaceae bacterium]
MGKAMYFDAHVHSAASPDSEADPMEIIAALKSKGLGVTFTEHADFVTPIKGRDMTATDVPRPKWGVDFICDFDMYPARYRHLRSDTALLGLEVGLTAAFLPLNTQVADNDYDFVLGSIHYVDGIDVYYDASKVDAETFCRRYLTYSLEMVEISGFFDSFAHIDYVARYSENISGHFYYYNYPKEFDALLKALADRELALEINTSRLGCESAIRQLIPIYKRFRALGGKHVTIGSDAHQLQGLGRYHDKAVDMAKIVELTPVYYKNRKPIICGA